MDYDYKKRDYLLPPGCKDLIDAQNLEFQKALQGWRERNQHRGLALKPSPPVVVKRWRKAAEQGNATAQYNLGQNYAFGSGVQKDEAEAVKWLRKAADQGSAQAQSHLGFMYAIGTGVTKDDVEAAKWFRKAADQGVRVLRITDPAPTPPPKGGCMSVILCVVALIALATMVIVWSR